MEIIFKKDSFILAFVMQFKVNLKVCKRVLVGDTNETVIEDNTGSGSYLGNTYNKKVTCSNGFFHLELVEDLISD